jgi:hypothetical protein
MRLQPRNPEAIARWLWSTAGVEMTFPRQVERAVAMALPVTVVALPRLVSDTIEAWLRRRRIPVVVPSCRHELMGCVVARNGHAFVLACGSDPADERRFTVAHEIAHLLIHYLIPRWEAVRALGEGILDVLDGRRPATYAERAAAVLSEIRIGAHVHLMARPGSSGTAYFKVEDDADRLALEILVPRTTLRSWLSSRELAVLSEVERCAAIAGRVGVPDYVIRSALNVGGRPRPPSLVEQVAAELNRRGR